LQDNLFMWNFSPTFCNERRREVKRLKAMTRKEAFDLATFARHTRACDTHDSRARLGGVRCPALLIGGDADIVMTTRHNLLLKELMPQSKVLTLPKAGHQLLVEVPEAVLPPIARFLDKATSALRPALAESCSHIETCSSHSGPHFSPANLPASLRNPPAPDHLPPKRAVARPKLLSIEVGADVARPRDALIAPLE
jgi:hypothetical protein